MRSAPAGVLALVALLSVSGAANAAACHEIVAQSTWGVKHDLGADTYWMFGRPPWAAKPSGDGVRVAVIASGIDPAHPDLQNKLACAWCFRDFVEHEPGPYDDNGHGTALAATVAGSGHIQPNPFKYYWVTGARGLAPHAELLVAKAVDADGAVTDQRIADAIRWATDPNADGDRTDGAQVILLSTGFGDSSGPADAPATRAATQAALELGTVVVMPAGNSGATSVDTPGDVPGVIAVGAVDPDGIALDGSNRGPAVDVFAPGAIVSATPDTMDSFDFAVDGYTGTCGPSMAAAVVAGSVALLFDAAPELVSADVGPERVAYVEALVAATGDPTADGTGRIIQVDGMLAAADRGSGAFYLPFFLALALVLAVVGRVGYIVASRVLAARSGDREGPVEPPE